MTAPSRTVLRPASRKPSLPGYAALRMVAEWASAVRGEQLYFGFDGEHATLAPEPGPGTLPVYTHPFTRRPEVTAVDLTYYVDGCERTITLKGRETSALFWSESSVEKFLLPYFASVAGGAAAPFFRHLAHAWYGYAPDEVQVCAVAIECGPARPAGRKRLTLEGMVALVCVVDGQLKRVPLKEFAKRFPGHGTGPSSGGHLGGVPHRETGWPVTGQVEDIVARDAAEFLSGLRGHTVMFETGGGRLTPVVWEGPTGHGREDLAGFECRMESVRSDRPAPLRVKVHVRDSQGGEHEKMLLGAGELGADPVLVPDSLFWGDGAVEKLLLPYYASVKGLAAPLFNTLLVGKWNGIIRGEKTTVEALCRVVAALYGFLGAPEPRVADDPVDENPYAITHLPRSEYIPEPGPGNTPLEARTRFLRLHGDPRGEALGGPQRVVKRSRKRTSRAT